MKRATSAAKCWRRFAGPEKTARKPIALRAAVTESCGSMADARDAVSSLLASVVALAGARIRAECASESRSLQLTRKRSYKTMDLLRHKSSLAVTPLGWPFFGDNPKRWPQRELPP